MVAGQAKVKSRKSVPMGQAGVGKELGRQEKWTMGWTEEQAGSRNRSVLVTRNTGASGNASFR